MSERLDRNTAASGAGVPPSRNHARLRIAVVVPALRVPKWVAKVIWRIGQCASFELCMLLLNRNTGRNSGASFSRNILFLLWDELDYRRFRTVDDAFQVDDLDGVLESFPQVQLTHISGSLPNALIEKIRAADLDVILDFALAVPERELAICARYGVWSFPGGCSRVASALPFFWAIASRSPVSETALTAFFAEDHSPWVVCRSYSSTNFLSMYLNQNASFWKASDLVMRQLMALHRLGWDYMKTSAERDLRNWAPINFPGNTLMARFLSRWTREALIYKLNKHRWFEQWFIAFCRIPDSFLTPLPDLDKMADFRLLLPPPDRCYMDPFVLDKDGKSYIFFEDFRRAQRKGVISYIEVDQAGNCTEPQVVLAREYHLSYPCVFEWRGETYMLPETRDNRTVEVYRAVSFPSRWTLEKVLLHNAPAVDPTLLVHEGRLWLFVGGMVDRASPNDELFLFSSDSLFGEWVPHPKNPVVSDVRCARPAGRLFVHDGQLIRPAQDCAIRYGFAVAVNRVEELSQTAFREVRLSTIFPDWLPGNLGTHTFNQSESLQVIDGRSLIAGRHS